jgi:hypothetical protein
LGQAFGPFRFVETFLKRNHHANGTLQQLPCLLSPIYLNYNRRLSGAVDTTSATYGMGDLEKETSTAEEEEVEAPLILEEYFINPSNTSTTPPSLSSFPLVSSRRYKKRTKFIVLFLLITGIALVVARVPFSQIGITISMVNGKNNEVLSMKKSFQTAESTINEEGSSPW